MGGNGGLNSLPIVPKASIYAPKVMYKPVMGGNTVSETSCFSSQIGAVGRAVKGRERPTIPSMYAQMLFMGPKYNTATCLEEFG